LLRQASGEVLEIATGTGRNLRHYPQACRITGVDFSAAMLEIAHREAHRLDLRAR
jgi:ubiquinone/menaquinone biosynthesis C-methylase UbiE